jgi:23S rRNA pseudouridine1911/1915/1917 synthase
MSAAFKNYHVAPELSGQALVAALRQLLPGQPWSAVRRLVENRHVQINGNVCVDEGRKLSEGDVIKVWDEPRDAAPTEDAVKILFQDSHLIVVDKPAGITTERHAEERHWSAWRKQRQPTIDEIVARILQRQRGKGRLGGRSSSQTSPRPSPGKRGGHVPRVRLVHRLDRDTSGVMVLALSAEAERALVQMFRRHDIHRVYRAIALGRVKEQTIESSLARDRGDRRRGSTTLPNVGKRAVTHVRPVEYLGDYTLLECRLETGRTHQIRIHLAEAGHPLCGEKVYNKPLFKQPITDRSGAQRQALHAAALAFTHPIPGQELSFTTPLPADMERLLARLRGLDSRATMKRNMEKGDQNEYKPSQ